MTCTTLNLLGSRLFLMISLCYVISGRIWPEKKLYVYIYFFFVLKKKNHSISLKIKIMIFSRKEKKKCSMSSKKNKESHSSELLCNMLPGIFTGLGQIKIWILLIIRRRYLDGWVIVKCNEDVSFFFLFYRSLHLIGSNQNHLLWCNFFWENKNCTSRPFLGITDVWPCIVTHFFYVYNRFNLICMISGRTKKKRLQLFFLFSGYSPTVEGKALSFFFLLPSINFTRFKTWNGAEKIRAKDVGSRMDLN